MNYRNNMNGQPLVVIAGLPRSGTSWLGKIFDSHPDTAYRAEPDNYPQLKEVPLFPLPGEGDTRAIQTFVEALPRLNSYRHTGKPPVFTKSYRSWMGNLMFHGAAAAGRFGAHFGFDVANIAARVDGTHPAPVMVWKSIRSLGRLELLSRSVPDVRIVHLIRHPCGHIGSILRGAREAGFPQDTSEYFGLFEQLLKTPQGRRHGLTLDELKELSPEERLAWQWLLVNEKAMGEGDDPTHVRVIRYEDVCRRPIFSAQRLFEFASLGWDPQTAAFVEASVSNRDQRYFSVFKDPNTSANRWRSELSADCIARITSVMHRSSRLAALYGDARETLSS